MKKFNDITSNEDYIDELKNQFGIDTDETRQFELHKLYSKYWMDCLPKDDENLISLVSYRKAVANFVKINTLSAGIDKPIAVKFSSSDESYTDTKNFIVLSAKIDNKDFDAVVGLALHESNHVIDTDGNVNFRLMATDAELQESRFRSRLPLSDNLLEEITRLKMDDYTVRSQVNELRNWIEDRRIDQNGWKRSPGYRPYYKATYNKYYGNTIFKIALQSKMFRTIDWESYKFRMFNILNPASDLNALPGLNKISKMLSGDSISRLTSNYDSTILSMKIITLMYSYFKEDNQNSISKDKNQEKNNQEQNDNSSGNSKGTSPNGNGSEGGTGSPDENKGDNKDDADNKDSNEKNADDTRKNNKENEDNTNYGDNPVDNNKDENENSTDKETPDEKSDDNKKDLNKSQARQLKKSLAQQLDYINGKTKKETLGKETVELLDAIDKSNVTIEKVQGDATTGLNVMVVRNLTKEILAGLPIGSRFDSTLTPHTLSEPAVAKGIQLGKMLATKLQIRNDSKVYKSKRKTSGKIDKRLLYSVGFGDSSIFEKTKVDQFGDALVHISVDASGSMIGLEWSETLTAITAIAYAASTVKNLDVVISFRSTAQLAQLKSTPLMVIAYDSRKDSFVKIRNLFPCIKPSGCTPEGLCYEAVIKDILNDSNGKIGYFINFSDGYPNMVNKKNKNSTNYAPEIAKVMVDKMRSVGIRVLAFFLGVGGGYALETFKYMYGKDSKEIPVTELYPLAKELNKMFATQKN